MTNLDQWMERQYRERFQRRAGLYASCMALIGCVAGQLQAMGEPDDTPIFVRPTGPPSNKHSDHPVMTASGRFVAFDSWADNLVPRDGNDTCDVFVLDRATGSMKRLSVSAEGRECSRISFQPAIAQDGRFVAFASDARTLVPGDKNGATDVFVTQVASGKIARVSVASSGREGNGASRDAAISGDGRLVLFASAADNLVESDTNRANDVFLHDRSTGKTTRVSVGAGGVEANAGSGEPAISADGRFAVFYSHATNLVPNDTNNAPDVFIHDIEAHTTRRISVGAGGAQANRDSREPSISGAGRFVAFESWATNLAADDTNTAMDVFVYDQRAGVTERVSVSTSGAQGDGDSRTPFISRDGRYVVFTSFAGNLVDGDTNQHADVFLRDRKNKTTKLVSVRSDGTQGKHDSDHASVSADGRWVTFGTKASNLLPDDKNHAVDIVVWDARDGELTRITTGHE